MGHPSTRPHVLLIEPTPILALLSSAELDAAGFDVTLSGSLADAYEWVHALLDSQLPARPTLIVINLAVDATRAEPLPSLQFVRNLRAGMAQGQLRYAAIVGLVEQPSASIEAAARAIGCYLLSTPLRTSAAHLLQEVVNPSGHIAPRVAPSGSHPVALA